NLSQQGGPSWVLRLMMVISAIAFAWITYVFVERPLRFGHHSRKRVLALLASMALIGTIGISCYLQQGFDFRFPKNVRYLIAVEEPLEPGGCFLSPTQDFDAFGACPMSANNIDRPVLFLWGDSHAAHLLPGYKALFGADLNIVPRTASFCPPLLGFESSERPFCRSINDKLFSLISHMKPDKIVLGALWPLYAHDRHWLDYLAGTIKRLRDVQVQHITLIGPVPQWRGKLPNLLLVNALKASPTYDIATRMKAEVNPAVFTVDATLRRVAKQSHVDYFSPIAILCDYDGCLTRLGDTKDKLIQWDESHLTAAGSRYLVSQIPRYQAVAH